MKHLIVLKDVAYNTGGVHALDSLAEGALTVLDEDNTVVAIAATSISGSKVTFYRGFNSDGTTPVVSVEVTRKSAKHKYHAYVAPQKQVSYIGSDGYTADLTTGAFAAGHVGLKVTCTTAPTGTTDFRQGTTALLKVVSGHTGLAKGALVPADTVLILNAVYEIIAAGTPDNWGGTIGGVLTPTGAAYSLNLPTLAAGQIAAIKITKRKEGPVTNDDILYKDYLVRTGDTDDDIMAALAAKFNNDPYSFVTVAVINTDDGLSVTAKDYGVAFDIALDGILIDSDKMMGTVGDSVPMLPGFGTAASLLAIEKEHLTYEGKRNNISFADSYWTQASQVAAGGTYNIHTLTWTTEKDRPTGKISGVTPHTLYLAVPTTSSTFPYANLATLMPLVPSVQ